ncbi:glutamate-5-semialdehyde dehydrogenase [Batrachochytrium dendrobatidis]|nr:glutamate-5-semialdehyde dehydrogenase [Batrachochytrium dendrobatidis]
MEALNIAKTARNSALVLQSASNQLKNDALLHIHAALKANKDSILAANRLDLEKAKAQVADGSLSASLFKRLDLAGPSDSKFDALLQGVLDIIQLDDPVGKVTFASQLDDGLNLYRVTCPVGVALIIFEARPEVVVQISSLILKSGNAVILKGGKEADCSNRALMECIQSALSGMNHSGVPVGAVQLVSSRDVVDGLLKMDGLIDLVIPRGGAGLVKHVRESTKIPVLSHADGICSVYVDEESDAKMAAAVIVDSKTDYPAACNAAETLLIHSSVLSTHLPIIGTALLDKGVQLRCDEKALALLESLSLSKQLSALIIPATPKDFDTEFLDLIMAVKVVDSLEETISHINTHGSKHTDVIVTCNKQTASRFMAQVDAGSVYWNASTRFTDGFRYGFGAEIGVSTNKTHVRGPVGLEGLMIYRYRIYGNGHTVAPYNSGEKMYCRQEISLSDAQKRI